MSHYLSENELLEILNITSFEQIDSSNFRAFMKVFKDIDPEVARHALSLITDFQKLVMSTLDEYKHNYDRTVDGILKVHSDYTDMCLRIMDMLSVMSEDTENPTEVKIAIINALLEMEKRYSDKGREIVRDIKDERKVQNNNVRTVTNILLAGLMCGIAFLLGSRGPWDKGGRA